MAALEPATAVSGVPLPFATYEHQPRRAVARAFALIRHWSRNTCRVPSTYVARLGLIGAEIAGCRGSGILDDEQKLAQYSTLVRLGASMWQLRHVEGFDDVVTHMLSIEDVADFAHDECLLFLAAKLRAGGLPVVPPARGGNGVPNPDLHAAGATYRGRDIYFEQKERAPHANREQAALSRWVRRQTGECADQIRGRGAHARGFACLDFGIVQEHQIPVLLPIVHQGLERHRDELYGVLVSATLLKRIDEAKSSYFVPVFRSHMIDSSDVYQGPHRLSIETIRFLHRAFHPRGAR